MKKRLIPLFFLLLTPIFANAQTDTSEISNSYINGAITISANPTVPQPGDLVTVTLQAPPIDLNKSLITWKLNGKTVSSGTGNISFKFNAGPLGKSDDINATIETETNTYTQNLSLGSSEVDLLMQGGSYVPPFFEGRPLWSRQSQLLITAIPHVSGNSSNPSSFTYKWIKDGTVLGSQSGAGKNTLVISDSVISMPIILEVDVYANRDTLVASAQKTFIPSGVSMLVYENNPLYGFMFNRAVSSDFNMEDKEVTFAAFPLFFNTANRLDPNLTYAWKTSADKDDTPSVTYRAPESSGSSAVTTSITNESSILQRTSMKFNIQFGQ